MDPATIAALAGTANSLIGGGAAAMGAAPPMPSGPITFGAVNVGGIASPIMANRSDTPANPFGGTMPQAAPVYGVTSAPGVQWAKYAGMGLLGLAAVLLIKNRKG